MVMGAMHAPEGTRTVWVGERGLGVVAGLVPLTPANSVPGWVEKVSGGGAMGHLPGTEKLALPAGVT